MEEKKNKNCDERGSFIFYRSFYEAIISLPKKSQINLFKAIMEYSFNQNLMELIGFEKVVFDLIKPQLDANNKRYENGKKGGRPVTKNIKKEPKDNQKITKVKPKNNQTESKPKPNKNVNDNVNDNVNVVVAQQADNDHDFKKFWNEYSKKGYIEDTYAFWESFEMSEELLAKIVTGAKNYSAYCIGDKFETMVYPRTFLINEMWKDYQECKEMKSASSFETPTMTKEQELEYFKEMGIEVNE